MSEELPSPPAKKRKRKKAWIPQDFFVHEQLSKVAGEKLTRGEQPTETEIIALFKSSSLTGEQLDRMVSVLIDQGKTALLSGFDEHYVDAPSLESEELRVWCPNVEIEVIGYFAKNPSALFSLEPRKFEELIAAIFRNHGFVVELTPRTRDGGVDIIAIERSPLTGDSTHLIECKRYAPDNKVGIGIVQRLVGTVTQMQATKGILVTTSTFTQDARVVARDTKHILSLNDYRDVVAWLEQICRRGN